MCSVVCSVAALVFLSLIIPPVRRTVFSCFLLVVMKRMGLVPSISETERQAIEAGNSWIEKEFFSGKPNLKTLLSQPMPKLTADEQAFLDQQVETLCKMVDDWKLWRTRDVPKEVWDYLLRERFMGMLIPKEHGGLGFSPYAQSEVIKKIASHSFVIGIYVMVPNSLGPGELIEKYGTDEQKKKYLPRLAVGEEIPCFALTETTAGSDAGNMQSKGVLFRKNGELFIRVNWDKRYITMAKISTLMGVAFHLYDPEKLMGGEENLGITCALVPTNTKGITTDTRHDPLGVPFYNSPTRGKDIEIPVSEVVGGASGIGKGWMMLMECLAAGRGIAFPAQMAGSSQLALRYTVGYAQVREQFSVPIAKFEGIQRPLARIVSFTYLNEALRVYAASALNQGVKSAVIASISKYFSTENSRKIIMDVMDVLGGAGISFGPRNKIAPYYVATPLSITVEGANILTRCLMIFGQGAFRSHPYAFPMIDSLQKNDLKKFDRALLGFLWHLVSNSLRSLVFSLTRGWAALPFSFKKQSVYYRRIKWGSATFAFFTDVAMVALGGSLKFKESITGRFADVMSNLYLAAAVLRKYEAEGENPTDWPVVKFTLDYLFHEIQTAFHEIYGNFPHKVLGLWTRFLLVPWSRLNPIGGPVRDRQVEQVVDLIYGPNGEDFLSRLSQGIFQPQDPKDHLNQVETAARFYQKVAPMIKKRKHQGVDSLSAFEKAQLDQWNEWKLLVVQVDEFTEEQYHSRAP